MWFLIGPFQSSDLARARPKTMRSPETRLASSLSLSGPFHNSDNPRWTNYLSRIFDAPVFEMGLFSHSARHSRGLYSDYATVRTGTISPATREQTLTLSGSDQ